MRKVYKSRAIICAKGKKTNILLTFLCASYIIYMLEVTSDRMWGASKIHIFHKEKEYEKAFNNFINRIDAFTRCYLLRSV